MISALSKTLQKTTQNITSLLGSKKDKCAKEELEEILIECDLEYELIESLLENLPSYISRETLNKELLKLLDIKDQTSNLSNIPPKPLVTLIVGVNGAGKTTTIAKLAHLAQTQNKKVMLAAGDTFRAAAIEQLKLWGEKLQIPVIATQHMHDPSAVAFDSINSAIAKNIDELYIDTAGRLHNHTNLNNELLKIVRVSQKALGDKPLRKFLVLDGTQGSSAINQVRIFSKNIDFDGIIITKLDGTSKGGALFSIVNELNIPILYIGIGERENDLIPFDSKEYVRILLDSIYQGH
ncbi:signal recognition particle-docking protein FtsY [Helicobacter sp. MIT 03-1614]|jgi:fused signal recognition particle receptor|uniref:Signal recognition particle receptor FtsY n=1 Tax=Helicobacter hepaticus (strain ATCC 51449 / 3B1) TaxID=235279 RepID=Q7VIL4_HELHP|nr:MULTISPECIES: signal recognition particle-docking protein FtsY [Helicobacter]AAP77187.1 signal recognition particle-docking GTPase FtsY [Helicobacter hepaticus ATCC 51449]TLD90034.1 signal recognition particle-docking protein FtsY [Helicobacter sp. MIT 03-1614]